MFRATQLPVRIGFCFAWIWSSQALLQPRQMSGNLLRSNSSAAARGSRPSGHWECDGAQDVWQDENYGSVGGPLSHDEVSSALADKWVLLVGDSSLRMVYHLLLGVLRWNWTQWPADVRNHGPTYYTAPKQSIPSNCSIEHNLEKPDESLCLQDTLQDSTRLSFLWMDYGDEYQTNPLDALAKQGTPSADKWKRNAPDTIVFSMGAWHLRDEKLDALKVNLDERMTKLEALFPESHKILAGVPNCNSNPVADTNTTNDIMLEATSNHNDWVFFDRGSVTKKVCEGADRSCKLGWPHPIGTPLNTVAQMLLWQVQDVGADAVSN